MTPNRKQIFTVLDLAYNFSYKVLVDVTDGIHIVIRDLTR